MTTFETGKTYVFHVSGGTVRGKVIKRGKCKMWALAESDYAMQQM